MGLFDIFRPKPEAKKLMNAVTIDGYQPHFTYFGDNIMNSDAVQQVISCITSEMRKLTPIHERVGENGDTEPVPGAIQKVLNKPNELMSMSDLLNVMIAQVELRLNAYAIPVYKDKVLAAIYPVYYRDVDFYQDPTGNLYVNFTYPNGKTLFTPYQKVIHIRKDYTTNIYQGGDRQGQPDNKALLETLKINHTITEGIAEALKASFAVNGVIQYNTYLGDDEMDQKRKNFENLIRNSESGFLHVDKDFKVQTFEKNVKMIDSDTMKFIDSKILRHFGVPRCILEGDYTPEQYAAFYQKTLEPLIKSLGDSFTSALFSDGEIARGNRITFFVKDLVFMTTDQALEMIRLLGDSGAIYENEKRTVLGLKPLPELVGVRKMSLNYINVEDASKYQTGNDSDEGGDQDEK